MLDRLIAVIVMKDNDEANGICWGLSSNGSFTFKSVYSLLLNPHHVPNDIWKLNVPQKSKNVSVGHIS